MKPQTRKGYAFIFSAVIAGSIFNLIVDYIFRTYPEVAPDNLLFWSLGGAILLAAPFFLVPKSSRTELKKIAKTEKQLLYIIGGLSLFAIVIWSFALKESSAGIIVLLSKLVFLFAFLFGIFFLKEKVTQKELCAMLILISGIFVISNLEGEASVLAVFLTLLASFFYALTSFFTRKIGRNTNMKALTFLRAVIVFVGVGILLVSLGRLEYLPTEVLILGTISEVFGIILWGWFYFESHKYLEISKLNLVVGMDILMVPILAFFIFGDALSNQKILGAFLILLGLFFFMREQAKTGKI